MWNRAELKSKSKKFLKANIATAILICIFYSFVSGIFGNNTFLETASDTATQKYSEAVETGQFEDYENYLNDNSFEREDGKIPYYFYLYKTNFSPNQFKEIYGLDLESPNNVGLKLALGGGHRVFLTPFQATAFGILSLITSIFILNPITIGFKRYFINGNRNLDKKEKFGIIFSSFKDGSWNKVGLKLFIENLYLSLWYSLFILPGIYKTYQYFYVDYILADNPKLSLKEAINISKEMTSSDKMNIFVLGISFLGWRILSLLFLGLGFTILVPYIEGTYANLYLTVKNQKFNTSELEDNII